MKNQPSLFGDVKCHVCGFDLVPTVSKPHLREGFYDADTNEYCHFGPCQKEHYKQKQSSCNSTAITYSELPVRMYCTGATF